MNLQTRILNALSDEQYQEIQALHRLCESAEGLHLKINWDMIKNRLGDERNDYLAYADGRLIGYLALYVFHDGEAEVSAIVHPDHRRQGIFATLLEEARKELVDRRIPQFLFIVDEKSSSGQAVARRLGTRFDHSEFKMKTAAGEAVLADTHPLSLTRATERDLADMAELDGACFGPEFSEVSERSRRDMDHPQRLHYLYREDGRLIGKVNLNVIEPGLGFVYGFCIRPNRQGQGIGRAMLSALMARYQDQVDAFALEVFGENRHALRLYERCGFRLISQDDYYALPTSAQERQ
ncbi:GNAT family N-acetyltransferase [Cohnella nanjingensis]|uniref:GNAT family N-acetyltransferase n=1 Tax=Cohnella nanjingensis TaxID=1387779 RepID=A0A7X0RU85_9BACL|nr:GNAT family N-acetyltransferase [Cohnella nanjingensis]MBB6673626.1 GNAT family N-acetyltransferase [Cohnella nanjingensis]